LSKAQSVINARMALGQSDLCLKFRCGDTWREPATLVANIQSIIGNEARLSPKPDWHPQPGFIYELRASGASERVEVRSYDPATGGLVFQWAPAHMDHTEIYFEGALLIWAPHVTVCSYVDPAKGPGPKPRFTRFKPAGPWQTAQSRSDTLTSTYTLSIAEPVAWIRTFDVLDETFRLLDSAAEVEANPGSWHWDGTNIWAHEWRNTPMAGGQNSYEYVLENKWDGICIGDVDDVRIDSIYVDGWGMTRQAAGTGDQLIYSGYGIRSSASDQNHVVLTGCEAYYNNRHCLGNVCTPGRGIWTVAGCSWGYCVEGGGAVSYAWEGGQEALFFECESRAGNVLRGLKPFANYLALSGYSHHCHSSDDRTIALFVSYRCRNAQTVSMAGHCGPNDVPLCPDLRQCRSFVVEDRYYARPPTPLDLQKPSADDSPGLLRPGLASRTAYVNCWFDHAQVWSQGNWVPIINQNLTQTRLINCVLTYSSQSDDYYAATPNVSWELQGVEASHCHFDLQVGTGRTAVSFGKAYALATNEIMNSILTVRGIDRSDPGASVKVGMFNPGGTLRNNYYSGFTLRSGAEGYDADPAALDGPWLLPGSTPGRALVSDREATLGGGYAVEYDRNWTLRRSPRTAVGPHEGFVPLGAILSSQLEIQKEGGRAALFIRLSGQQPVTIQGADALGDAAAWHDLADLRGGKGSVLILDGGLNSNKSVFFRVVGPDASNQLQFR
jgi:hypothetical protein